MSLCPKSGKVVASVGQYGLYNTGNFSPGKICLGGITFPAAKFDA